jgi:FMN phosphatase YigB (HAD superfamily)
MNKRINIVFDFDGMIFESNGYFTDKIIQSEKIPTDTQLFDKNLYESCKRGEVSFITFFEDFVSKLNSHSTKEYLYEDLRISWFEHSKPNLEIIKLAKQLKLDEIRCFILTDNVRERVEYLNSRFNLSEIFEITGSFQIGKLKSDITYYSDFCEQYKLLPEEVVFFDDKEDRVNSLNSNGFRSKLYRGVDQFISNLKDLKIPINLF